MQSPSRPQSRAPAQAWYLLAPIPVLLLSEGLLTKLHGDLWVADRVYALQAVAVALHLAGPLAAPVDAVPGLAPGRAA